MRVLTYTNGSLTVIREDDFYSQVTEKPSFIKGENFYYEPTLKMEDGKALSEEMITQAESFIENFVFTLAPNIEEIQTYYEIDEDGNYIGESHDENVLHVSTPPSDTSLKWFNGEWCECCLIDKESKKYKGLGDTRTALNAQYAPNTLPQDEFELMYYAWDGSSWSISIEDAKVCRKAKIREAQVEALRGLLGDVASEEATSFVKQEAEARAWLLDNATATPFIDTLLIARGFGESKEELVTKIVAKADAYAMLYSQILGKYHRLIKEIESATTLQAIKAIVW